MGSRRRWILLALVVLVMTVFASVATGAALLYAPRRRAPNVQVASVSLKGLPREEVALRLGTVQRTELVTWALEGALLEVPIRLVLDVEATLQRVFEWGRSGDLRQRWSDWRRLQPGEIIPAVWRVADGEVERVAEAFRSLAAEAPVDAALRQEGDRVWIDPGRDGRALDEGALAAQVAEVAAGRLRFDLPRKAVAPVISTAAVEALGVSTLRGKMTTYYDAANLTRTNNILLASQEIRSVLLTPGETFSFNDRVGPRTAARGYQVAHVILADALVPGLGGGICQVSSTLYAAAVKAGMTVVERVNHSLPIWYMEPGMDATVSWEGPDLVLQNDTGKHLLITVESEVTGATTVRIFGPPGGGAHLESVVQSRFPPPVQRVVDPLLPPGQEVVEQEGQDGIMAVLYRVADGERTLVNQSYYQAHPRRIRVGPELEPVPNWEEGLLPGEPGAGEGAPLPDEAGG